MLHENAVAGAVDSGGDGLQAPSLILLSSFTATATGAFSIVLMLFQAVMPFCFSWRHQVPDQHRRGEKDDISISFFQIRMRLSTTRVCIQPHKHILNKTDKIDRQAHERVTPLSDRLE